VREPIARDLTGTRFAARTFLRFDEASAQVREVSVADGELAAERVNLSLRTLERRVPIAQRVRDGCAAIRAGRRGSLVHARFLYRPP